MRRTSGAQKARIERAVIVRRSLLTAFFALLASVVSALASAPERSLRPTPRPTGQSITETLPRVVHIPVYYSADIRPVPRPVAQSAAATPPRATPIQPVFVAATVPGVVRSPRPPQRPRIIRRVVATTPPATQPTAAVPPPRRTETRAERRRREREERRAARRARRENASQPLRGSVCGSRGIRGEQISRIRGAGGCGIDNPVRITEVDGVALSTPATVNCDTARALQSWLRDGVTPAVGRLGGGVQSLRVVSHYSCRTRNSQRGARLSEHAKGNAIDIAAFRLNNGSVIDVESGWNRRAQSQVLRQMHRSACGTFGTVLGPNADRFHRDHFHLDVARHRGGAYCR